MPIQIVKEKPRKRKVKPHYILKYEYMIGDANGDTSESVKISADNPHLERYVKLLRKVKPCKGCWGTQLNSEDLENWLEEKQITQDDFNFLKATMFEGGTYYGDDDVEEEIVSPYDQEEDPFLAEFYEGVQADAEYSFLVFQGLDLKYVNEKGEKQKVRVK